MDEIETSIDIADFSDDEKTKILGALLVHWDDELAGEVSGIAQVWADRRTEADAGGEDGWQMGARSAEDLRALSAAIEQHREHLKRQQ